MRRRCITLRVCARCWVVSMSARWVLGQVCVCVCECVCEREFVCMCVCACVCVLVDGLVVGSMWLCVSRIFQGISQKFWEESHACFQGISHDAYFKEFLIHKRTCIYLLALVYIISFSAIV